MSAEGLEDASETLKQEDAENESLPLEDLLNTHSAKETAEDSEDSRGGNTWKETQENEKETSTFRDPIMMKCFSFKNEPKSFIQESLIPTVNHDFKYIPFFCTTEYLTASMDDKVRMLEECHAKLSKDRANLYRKSFILAPLPPPIQLYSPSNNVHENNVNEVDSMENTYISRSGRCTKRKNYNETLVLRKNAESKSEENADTDWLSKNSSGNKNIRKRKKNVMEVPKTSSEKGIKKHKIELEATTVPSNEETELDDTLSSTTPEKKNEPKSENKTTKHFTTRQNSRKLEAERSENDASLSKVVDEDYEVCPICSKNFLVDEIEAHASSCGEMR